MSTPAVTIRLPAPLRRYAAGNEYVTVAGSTVSQALDALVEMHPDLGPRIFDTSHQLHPHLLVFLHDALVPRTELADAALRPGDHIDLLIGITGGTGQIVLTWPASSHMRHDVHPFVT